VGNDWAFIIVKWQVNIQRDPRWGRNSNSPSEDPLLTGLYGQALVTGTQTPADNVNLINSQMKHWTAYGVESNRMGFNGNVSVHDMSETYMVPLQLMLKANVSSAMCACESPPPPSTHTHSLSSIHRPTSIAISLLFITHA
jgi:beta-glucosidase-like glycosyl hydrolase